MGLGWFEEDAFGVPGRMLNLSNDFYGALGRVAAMGALAELKMSDLIRAWTKSDEISGQPLRYQLDRFKLLRMERDDVPPRLVQAVSDIEAVMMQRHELIHGIWPGEAIGWRNVAKKISKGKVVRPAGAVPNEIVGVEDIKAVVRRVVAAIDGVVPFISSPVD
jgi:hypothetical protein